MRLKLTAILILFVALTACSKSHEDYNSSREEAPPINPEQVNPTIVDQEEPSLVNLDGFTIPAWQAIDDPLIGGDHEGTVIADAKAEFNSNQPIVYEGGAGGITFNTTFEESKSILSKPRSGPDASGTAYYEGEGLQIVWRTDEPRIPVAIYTLNNYQGKMKMFGGKKQFVGMKDSFVAESDGGYSPNEFGAAQFAKDYYRFITGNMDVKDCLAEQLCLIDYGTPEQENFVFQIPGRIMWLLSKDRLQIYVMLLLRQVGQGILANDLNILTGQFLIPNEAPLGFGDTFQDVEERLKVDTFTAVSTNSYGREYDGVYLVYKRTKFDRKDTTPLADDKMLAVQVWNNYRNRLTLDGKPIIVRETANSVDVLTLEQAQLTPPPEGARQIPLNINLALQDANVRPFAEKLTKFLETQLQMKYPNALVSSRFSGAHQVVDIKDYSAYVVAYDAAADDGLFLSFGIGEEQGNLQNFFVTKVGSGFNAMDPLILTRTKTPVEKRPGAQFYDTLSGVTIGDTIAVTDWDLGRGEATVAYSSTNYQEVVKAEADASAIKKFVTRASYSDISAMFVAFDQLDTTPQNQGFVSVGSLGISIGIKLISETPETLTTKATRLYRVISVGSSLHNSEVRGLCQNKFTPTFGMSDTAFLTKLKETPECKTLITYDTTGDGRISSVYFPDDRLRLSFGDEELVQATVYAPVNEVK